MEQTRAGALLPEGETHGGSTTLLVILRSSPDRPGGKRGCSCASNLKHSRAAPPLAMLGSQQASFKQAGL